MYWISYLFLIMDRVGFSGVLVFLNRKKMDSRPKFYKCKIIIWPSKLVMPSVSLCEQKFFQKKVLTR